MARQLRCPRCRTRFDPSLAVGSSVTCPGCQVTLRVPVEQAPRRAAAPEDAPPPDDGLVAEFADSGLRTGGIVVCVMIFFMIVVLVVQDSGKKPDPFESADWPSIVADLRSGRRYDDPTRPEHRGMAALKALDHERVLHKLVDYVGGDDPYTARAAHFALEHLTGRDEPDAPDADEWKRRELKLRWQVWLSRR